MSVTVLIVLGDKIRLHIDETTQEHWFMSYIGNYFDYISWSMSWLILNADRFFIDAD